MKKKMMILMTGMFFFLLFFPIKVFAKSEQIICHYSYTAADFDLNKISFSYTVYDDTSAIFNGFKGCEERNGETCYLNGKPFQINKQIEGNKFGVEAYGKDGSYACPVLSFVVGDYAYTVQKTTGGIDSNTYELTVKTEIKKQENTEPHKQICTFNAHISGLGDMNYTFFYEGSYNGQNKYSMAFRYKNRDYLTSSSNLDLNAAIDGINFNIPRETLNALFGDYNPNEIYTKCGQKVLYFNNYDLYYKLETSKLSGSSSSEIRDPNNPNNPSEKDPSEVITAPEASCTTLLGPKTTKFLKTLLNVIQIGGLVLAMILGMMDFIGAMISGEADANKKAFNKLKIRISMAAILLLVPAILKLVFTTFGMDGNSFCIL